MGLRWRCGCVIGYLKYHQSVTDLNSFLIMFFHSIRSRGMLYRSREDLFGSLILHVVILRTPDFSFCNWHLIVSKYLSTVSCVGKSKELSPGLSTKPHSNRMCHPPCSSKCRAGKSPTPTELSLSLITASYFLMENRDVGRHVGTPL